MPHSSGRLGRIQEDQDGVKPGLTKETPVCPDRSVYLMERPGSSLAYSHGLELMSKNARCDGRCRLAAKQPGLSTWTLWPSCVRKSPPRTSTSRSSLRYPPLQSNLGPSGSGFKQRADA